MPEHDDRLPLHQMLEHAREALELIRHRERAEIATNRMLQFSLNYLILVVGEAATQVSTAGRAQYPGIPFSTRRPGPSLDGQTTRPGWLGERLDVGYVIDVLYPRPRWRPGD